MAVENSILSQVQSLVTQLSPKEQQEIIQTIVSMKSANEAALTHRNLPHAGAVKLVVKVLRSQIKIKGE